MRVDPNGHFSWKKFGTGIGITTIIVVSILLAVPSGGTSVGFAYVSITAIAATGVAISYGNAADAAIVLDVSYSDTKLIGVLNPVGGFKGGVSIVIDFGDDSVDVYPHLGSFAGYSQGLSYSAGIISDYNSDKGYKGHFLYAEASYYGGVGHCWDPTRNYNETTRAYYFEFSSRLSVIVKIVPDLR